MPYRTDLKRPDLKGQFPCTVCHKIFCHSSSLSRHRMQAHYKCYICTQCNQEIHSSETLRSHMYRCHQIHRMFMCRCCNWAFPDKTSLHIHMQSMQKSGKPGDVSVLARSSLEVSGAGDDSERAHSLGSPTNSSPDEEHQYRGESISPSISEMEMDEQQHADYEHQNLGKQEQILSRVKLENEDTQQQQHQTARTHQNNAGIFPNQLEAPAAEFLLSKFGIKSELATTLEDKANYQNAHHQHHDKQHQQQLNLLNVVGQSNPNPSFALSPAATLLQQQPWLGQMLANNPYFTASAIDKTGTTSLMSAYHHQQQHGPPPNNNSKVIQTFCAALASAAAAAAASKANNPQAASVNLQSAGVIAQHQQPSPPQKKPRKSDKRRGTSVPTNEDLRLQIPQQQSPLIALSPAMSEGSTTAGKLNSLISNLLSIRSCTDGSQGSPLSGNGEDGKCPSSAIGSDRKNKRKMRTPTRSEMTEIIYGDEPEGEEDEMPKKSADMLFPCIQSFMEKSQPSKGNNNAAREQQNSDQQPSPAVSDSQTSGSCHSHTEAGGHMLMDGGCGALISPKKCESCQIFDGGPTELHKTTVHMIGRIAERITKLSDSVEENKAKEGLLDCAKQLRDIVDRH